ncbi:MAG: ParB/RepB/Spo0J family partition protein [Actinomycetota bacterium]|nr:ParB/RepB/Spo0J family partition protein [Actinomycetota bacterium]
MAANKKNPRVKRIHVEELKTGDVIVERGWQRHEVQDVKVLEDGTVVATVVGLDLTRTNMVHAGYTATMQWEAASKANVEVSLRAGDTWQVLPELDSAEWDSLRESMRRDGFDWAQPVVIAGEDGAILEGHHRYAAARKLGINPPTVVVTGLSDEEKRERILVREIQARRHLGPQKRRELIAQLREEGMSVRQIAEKTGVAKSTVADDVKQVSETGQLNQPDRITGRDGRSRPATQPRAAREVSRDRAPERARSVETDTGLTFSAGRLRSTLDVPSFRRAEREIDGVLRFVQNLNEDDIDADRYIARLIGKVRQLAHELRFYEARRGKHLQFDSDPIAALTEALSSAGDEPHEAEEIPQAGSAQPFAPGEVIQVSGRRGRRFKVTGYDDKGNVLALECHKDSTVAGQHAFKPDVCKVDRKATADLAARQG